MRSQIGACGVFIATETFTASWRAYFLQTTRGFESSGWADGLGVPMQHILPILETHRHRLGPLPPLVACIDACFDCAQACTSCADACVAEPDARELLACIRLTQDCADVALATGRVLSRATTPDWEVIHATLRACVLACEHCAEQCACHASHHPHCRISAEACHECATACLRLLPISAES